MYDIFYVALYHVTQTKIPNLSENTVKLRLWQRIGSGWKAAKVPIKLIAVSGAINFQRLSILSNHIQSQKFKDLN